MSANVIPMPLRSGDAFEQAYPAGVPSSLHTSPIVIDSAADAIAVLAGLEWDALTPTRRNELRRWAMLAATCAHPEGLRLVGYAVGKSSEFGFVAAAPVVRRGMVEKFMGAVKGASERIAGTYNPDAHANLVRLMREDIPVLIQDRKRGGW